jgi:hypothetical protein
MRDALCLRKIPASRPDARHILRAGFTIEVVFNLTRFYRRFLVQIKEIVDFEDELH